MKKLLVVMFLVAFASCSDDNTEVKDDSLNGKWTLTNVICFCGFPETPNFTLTEVSFRSNDNEIDVGNKGEFSWFREDGTYAYSGNGNRITLENGSSYDFEITGNIMQLIFVDQPEISDDEVTFSFVRN